MFLFRRKYGLAPTDPRVLDATLEAVQLDLELDHVLKDEQAWECKPCGGWTYRDRCPWCGADPSVVGSKFEELIAREARGEIIPFSEYEKLYFPDKVSSGDG